jgi:hypothetical protein
VIPFFIATNSFRNRLLTEQQRELPLGLKHNEIRSLCLILTSLKIGNQFPDLRDTKYRIWVECALIGEGAAKSGMLSINGSGLCPRFPKCGRQESTVTGICA